MYTHCFLKVKHYCLLSSQKFIQPTGPPFGSDNKSTWEREADIIAAKEVICESVT